MKYILYWAAWVQVEYTYWKWLIITVGRHTWGRWYVFRDAPEWFVKAIASTQLTPEEEKDKRMASYHEAARAELRLRERW